MKSAVSGVICISPRAPACEVWSRKLRFLVDHRGDQRRVEVLVGGLLADDVVVSQRQRDLAHGLAERTGPGDDGKERGREQGSDGDRRQPASP